MRKAAAWAIALSLTCSTVFWGCAAPEEVPEPLRPVRYERVTPGGEVTDRTFSGVIEAGFESRLSFRVPGTVQRIHVAVGDRVTEGELIAELDQGDFELEVQRAEASRSLAQAEARRAEADYQRARSLYETQGVSRGELDAARAAAEAAEASVEAQEKQLALARSQAGYTRLRAPANGAIAAVPVDENENVAAGQPVVLLTSGGEPKVRLTVPEGLIGQVEEGAPVEVRLDAVSDRAYEAVVVEVGVAATGIGATFPVTARIREAGPEVRPGMAAEAMLRFQPTGDTAVYFLPPHAVEEDRHGRHVFVVEPEENRKGRVHRRDVVAGALTRHGIEIFEGVEEGDRVVTAGVRHLEDGQRVRLLSEPDS